MKRYGPVKEKVNKFRQNSHRKINAKHQENLNLNF